MSMNQLVTAALVGVLGLGAVAAFGQQTERQDRETRRSSPRATQDQNSETQDSEDRESRARTGRTNQADAADQAWSQWWSDWWEDEEQAGKPGTEEQRFQSGVREFIRRNDRNADGFVSQSELPRNLRDAFQRLDANDDGFLSRAEIDKHARQMRQSASGSAGTMSTSPMRAVFVWFLDADEARVDLQDMQQAYEMLQDMDQDGDGEISRKELQARRQQTVVQWCDRCFDQLDKNGDGKLDSSEARHSVFASHFSKFDKNQDDMLTSTEIEQGIQQAFTASRQRSDQERAGQEEATRTARGKSKGIAERDDEDQKEESNRKASSNRDRKER